MAAVRILEWSLSEILLRYLLTLSLMLSLFLPSFWPRIWAVAVALSSVLRLMNSMIYQSSETV